MARINDGVLPNWNNGQTMHEADYELEREILRTAINDNYSRVIEVDTEITDLKSRTYTKEETVLLVGGSGFIDGGNFNDTYSNQFTVLDGGEF